MNIKQILMKIGHVLEKFIIKSKDKTRYSPIFIIAPARTGSTLIYQYLTYSLKLSYIPNISCKLPISPVIITKIFYFFNSKKLPNDFHSKYGKTKGFKGPNQGYKIWKRWFPKRKMETIDIVISEDQRREIIGIITSLEKIFKGPFINKWQGHGVNILKLNSLFPNALFIRVHRDHLQTAQSVLKGRREIFDDPYRSISRVPKSYRKYRDSDYIKQVCAYVLTVENKITEDSKTIGSDRFFDVKYEDFCKKPEEFLKNFISWYKKKTGYKIQFRNDDYPKEFNISKTKKVSSKELALLKKYLIDEESNKSGGDL